jgi:3-deoxy-D-manno-octulosonate 8-phosphate phosphatase (KDO 8-P phosphatase)
MITKKILNKATKIKLLVLDVDGVLTDNKLYIDNKGNEFKAFNVRDGIGIKMLLRSGIEIALISGRISAATTVRAKALGIKHIYLGYENKHSVFHELKSSLKITDNEIAYVGDDLPDLPLIAKVGLGIAVNDAIPAARKNAQWITQNNGGYGAVREVCELILKAQKKLASQIEYYTKK